MKRSESEHVAFVFALFEKTVPKRSSIFVRIRKRMRRILGIRSPTSNVDHALARASKLSLTITKSFNISQGPQLDERKRNCLKNSIISFLNNGRKIYESKSKLTRKKKELIRSLIRKTTEELNKYLLDIDGNWLQGYGHIHNDAGKPGLLSHQNFIYLFNEFVNNNLIICDKGLNESALAIKSVFGSLGRDNFCNFRLSSNE